MVKILVKTAVFHHTPNGAPLYVGSMGKIGGTSPLGVARAACFEEMADVFASSGAML